MKIIVPDYYKDFKCKCGECRHSCCMGWRVTVSQDEYFRLLGMECSPDVRRRIDCAFFTVSTPSPERFAEIKHNYLGRCPIQREDGLCTLHFECGEEALPTICRTYPRNMIYCIMGEGACANSCEKTIELLIEKKDSLGFEEVESPISMIIEAPKELSVLQQKRSSFLKTEILLLRSDFANLEKCSELKRTKRNTTPKKSFTAFFTTLFPIWKDTARILNPVRPLRVRI